MKTIHSQRGPAPVLLVLCYFSLPLFLAGDWPQFLGPQRNGRSSETGLAGAWNKEGPPVIWEKAVGAGFAGPAVAQGKLILFHRVANEEVIEALEAGTGKEIWKCAYPTNDRDDYGVGEGPRATPTVAADTVFTLGASGDLYAVGLQDGKVRWHRAMNDEYKVQKGYFGVATSPLVEGKLLLLNIGGAEAGIVALDTETGKEMWRSTKDEASYSSPVVATLGGQRVAVFLTRLGIVILEPATGKVLFSKRWRARINASVNAASPVVFEDRLFFTSSYSVGAIALRATAGAFETLWQGDESLTSHYGTPVALDGMLYGFDGRQEGGARLRCVELDTGKVRWTAEGFGCGSLILAEQKLYILSEKGELFCIAATPVGYREQARANVLNGLCRAQIALSDGRLYGRSDKKLVCWNLKKAP
ncbi:PQQ-like beta-propeller repeat protein [soil metagenome]